MLSHLPGPSLGGRRTLYTSVTVPFLRPEHSVTDSGAGRGPMLCFPGSAQLSGPSKLTPFIIHYLADSMHGDNCFKRDLHPLSVLSNYFWFSDFLLDGVYIHDLVPHRGAFSCCLQLWSFPSGNIFHRSTHHDFTSQKSRRPTRTISGVFIRQEKIVLGSPSFLATPQVLRRERFRYLFCGDHRVSP